MRLPKTSRSSSELKELRLGRGDYAAGGARSLPFLDLDNARRRRPLIFGEVTDDLSDYPELAAEMFSGRQTDPTEWAVMWKEIGADGICIRLKGKDPAKAGELVRGISDRTRLPIVLDAGREIGSSIMSSIDDSIMMVFSDASPPNGHIPIFVCDDADGASDACGGLDAAVSFHHDGDLRSLVDRIEEYRSRGLNGNADCSNPVIADVSYTWDSNVDDVRTASMHEASAALAVMMAGADMIIVRGPGAADMARVYGEELADL